MGFFCENNFADFQAVTNYFVNKLKLFVNSLLINRKVYIYL